jgi:hypothetical protein
MRQLFALRSSAPAGTQMALSPVQSVLSLQALVAHTFDWTRTGPPHEGASGPSTHSSPIGQLLAESVGQHTSLGVHWDEAGTELTQVRNPPSDSSTHLATPLPQSLSMLQSPELRTVPPPVPALEVPPFEVPPLEVPPFEAPPLEAPPLEVPPLEVPPLEVPATAPVPAPLFAEPADAPPLPAVPVPAALLAPELPPRPPVALNVSPPQATAQLTDSAVATAKCPSAFRVSMLNS